MNINESWSWLGKTRIIIYNLDGSIKRIDEIQNTIYNGAHNALRDILAGGINSLQIKYLAWGTSNLARDPTHTQLETEFGRKAITSQAAGGIGVQTTTTYIGPYEGLGAIAELGWFAGPDASMVANSGLLIASVLYSHTKTNLESILVVRTDNT